MYQDRLIEVRGAEYLSRSAVQLFCLEPPFLPSLHLFLFSLGRLFWPPTSLLCSLGRVGPLTGWRGHQGCEWDHSPVGGVTRGAAQPQRGRRVMSWRVFRAPTLCFIQSRAQPGSFKRTPGSFKRTPGPALRLSSSVPPPLAAREVGTTARKSRCPARHPRPPPKRRRKRLPWETKAERKIGVATRRGQPRPKRT